MSSNESQVDLHLSSTSRTSTADVLERNTKNKNLKFRPAGTSREIYVYEGVPLTIGNINKMEMDQREKVAEFIFQKLRQDGFPYPKFEVEDLSKDWSNLQALDTASLTEDGINISSFSTQGSRLFKHFFPHFFACTEMGKGGQTKFSMVDGFMDDQTLMRVIRNRLGITFFYRGVSYPFDMSGDMIRQGFRSMRLAPQTTNFRASVAKYLYDTYCPQNGTVLDYSLGFGQRFLGAIASDKVSRYIGVDPWKLQIDSTSTLNEFLGHLDSQKDAKLICNGSENPALGDIYKESIDFAFSSPPYFDKEVYTVSEHGQAYVDRSYQQFITDYWQPTTQNLFKMVKSGGVVGLNIVRTLKKHQIAQDMLHELQRVGFVLESELLMSYAKSHLSGKVGTDNTKKSEPIFILRKK